MKRAIALLLLITLCAPLFAQQKIAARPTDVDTVDHLIAALYDVISGPAGQKRDWERFRSLCIDGARFIPASTGADKVISARVYSPEDYIARATPFFEKEGFYEQEIHRRTVSYAHIMHVFSTYDSRHAKGEKPFARGINSIQLMNDGKRWWLVTIFWEGERPETPLPKDALPAK